MYLERKDYEAARKTFLEMRTSAPRERKEFQAQALFGLARVAGGHGDSWMSQRDARASLDLFTSMEHYQAAQVENWLAQL
jgi:hypothetical protein